MSLRIAIACLCVCGLCAVLAGCMSNAPAPSDSPSLRETPRLAPVRDNPPVTVADNPGKTSPADKATTEAGVVSYEKELLNIGLLYQDYQRLGEEPSWAPTLCMAPPPRTVEQPYLSMAKDGDAHGRKLYFLFAKDFGSYGKTRGGAKVEQPVGQVLVKESYRAEACTPETPIRAQISGGDGKTYKRGEKFALFVMMKLDKKTPGTHGGWVYGTLTADGKTVTSSGLVESCMGCHDEAPHDHLFGIDKVTNKPRPRE